MPRPSDAILWYYRVFKPAVEDVQLIHNKPEDWVRLQVWDGTTLKPVMPKDFSGMPTEEQINQLYSLMQKQELFFFELGDPEPWLITTGTPVPISMEPREPVAPPPLTSEEPTREERKAYEGKLQDYNVALKHYTTAQEIHGKCGAGFKTAVENYNASRDLEQDRKEQNGRLLNRTDNYVRFRINRDRADWVITDIMGPRPVATPEIFFEDAQRSLGAAFDYSFFENELEPNGYDLPENDRLDDYDAATINFLMLGVHSHNGKFLDGKNERSSGFAMVDATNGIHMLITGLFGTNRINIALQECLGEAMKLGKEAIEDYLNNGDPSLLGQRLGESLQLLKVQFTGTGQTTISESLVAASKITERALKLFEKNPEIWKATGLDDKELDVMRGYVQVGHIYDVFLDNQIKVNNAAAKGTELSPDEKAGILADAAIRKMVEAELKKGANAVTSSKEYEDKIMEAYVKDSEILANVEQWVEEHKHEYVKNEDDLEGRAALSNERTRLLTLHGWNANSVLAGTQPVEHPILTALAQPGMLERLRQKLMKDPAIQEQADKSPFAFTAKELDKSAKIDALAKSAQQLVELSQKQAWFENIKSILTQNDPSAWLDPAVASDSNRLMIAQGKGRSKTMVSVASLLQDGLQALQDPDKNTIDLLYENARNGNLYFYGKDKDMPARLETDGMKPSVQQLQPVELPTRWQRFWNAVTFGLAYAKECNIPDKDPAAYELIVRARAEHAAPVQNTEAPRPEGAANEQEQPEQDKTVQIKPWKYQVEDTREMDPDDFITNLALPRSFSLAAINVASVLENPDFKPEDYFTAVTQQLEAKILKRVTFGAIKRENPDERSSFINGWKENYPAMMSGLGKYVFDHTDKDWLIAYCQDPRKDSPAYTALINAADELINTAVAEYTKETNALNTENEKQQNVQSKEAAELTDNNPEPQKQNTGMGLNG